MSGHKFYLCEKPDQGRIVAKALGGGRQQPGGISGDGWAVSWGIGHLMTPYMPHEYDPELKKWSWDTLPIVPQKFLFRPIDASRAKQLKNIKSLMQGASELVISTDPDREGELIAYSIMNHLKWTGATSRLWLTDLTHASVVKALSELKDAATTKPLYLSAMARTYADWLVGMNLSRAATLKLAAFGAKPMSVGRVQTPVLGMIVKREEQIKNFKPQDYFEFAAQVQTSSGSLMMRYAPAADKRILDKQKAQEILQKINGAKGAISAKTEPRRQAPPPLLELTSLQQTCNTKFGWSAIKTSGIMQSLYETHKYLTYPRTDCAVLPEEHKKNIPVISQNISTIADFQHLSDKLKTPELRSSVYNDKKVGAHHAIVPTNEKPIISNLSPDEVKLYMLVCKHWIAAHMPDMEYLQTSIAFNANGVPLKASGRQITNRGWKDAFASAAGVEDTSSDDEDNEKVADEDQKLPPLKDGENAESNNGKIESKKTKAPLRYTEKTLLEAMKNIAAHVDDPSAKKTLKETSGIGTSATRANVIETLKSREYIKVVKRKLEPTPTAYSLINTMKSVAPSYTDPVMTARWEDVLEQIASGDDKVKAFVAGIAQACKKDVQAIKDSSAKRMEGAPGKKGTSSGPKPGDPKYIEGDWKKAIEEGTPLNVKFEQKSDAQKLGARWNSKTSKWVAPKGKDLEPFKKAGYL